MSKFELKRATAVVTGGSRGIGPHIAQALIARGARVALIARSDDELEATARKLREPGAEVWLSGVMWTSPEARREMLATVRREFGSVDVLVNNAGGDLQREFHNLDEDEIDLGARAQPDERDDPDPAGAPRHARQSPWPHRERVVDGRPDLVSVHRGLRCGERRTDGVQPRAPSRLPEPGRQCVDPDSGRCGKPAPDTGRPKKSASSSHLEPSRCRPPRSAKRPSERS